MTIAAVIFLFMLLLATPVSVAVVNMPAARFLKLATLPAARTAYTIAAAALDTAASGFRSCQIWGQCGQVALVHPFA